MLYSLSFTICLFICVLFINFIPATRSNNEEELSSLSNYYHDPLRWFFMASKRSRRYNVRHHFQMPIYHIDLHIHLLILVCSQTLLWWTDSCCGIFDTYTPHVNSCSIHSTFRSYIQAKTTDTEIGKRYHRGCVTVISSSVHTPCSSNLTNSAATPQHP